MTSCIRIYSCGIRHFIQLQEHGMKDNKRIAVFFDTNIFLHYQPIGQIKWAEILGGEVELFVIASVVLQELDDKKDEYSRKRIRDRARSAINLIEAAIASSSVKDDQNVRIAILDHVTSEYFDKGLVEGKADDELVAACLMYNSENPEMEVVLVSHDSGPRMKGMRYGIRVAKLPDEYRLPDEVDPQTKEIQQLRKQVVELQNRMPKLKVQFERSSDWFDYSALGPFEMSDEEVENKIAEIQSTYPRIAERAKAARTIDDFPDFLQESVEPYKNRLSVLFRDGIYDMELQRYDQELASFYLQWRQYLKYYVEYQNLERRTIEVKLEIENVGSAIASNVDVFLHFPDGFELLSKESYPEPWTTPVPPERPKTPIEFLKPIEAPDFSHLYGHQGGPVQAPNVSVPDIRRTNSFDVRFHIQELKQKLKESFEPLYVVFKSHDVVDSFTVDYRINCVELPDEIVGKLNVVVDRAGGRELKPPLPPSPSPDVDPSHGE